MPKMRLVACIKSVIVAELEANPAAQVNKLFNFPLRDTSVGLIVEVYWRRLGGSFLGLVSHVTRAHFVWVDCQEVSRMLSAQMQGSAQEGIIQMAVCHIVQSARRVINVQVQAHPVRP